MSFHVPERYRIRDRIKAGIMATSSADGHNGAFMVPPKDAPRGLVLTILASDGDADLGQPWEHVSVSTAKRCPYWDEMCFVKDLFWDAEDVVVQFHPAKSDYVNQHTFCLHLWRPVGLVVPMPPSIMVGYEHSR